MTTKATPTRVQFSQKLHGQTDPLNSMESTQFNGRGRWTVKVNSAGSTEVNEMLWIQQNYLMTLLDDSQKTV
jgi:hypothetical protein